MDIVQGLRVDSRKYRGGVCTGKTRSDGDLGLRAEVVWPNGMVRWPLVSILAPSTTPNSFVNDNHWTSVQLGDSRDV